MVVDSGRKSKVPIPASPQNTKNTYKTLTNKVLRNTYYLSTDIVWIKETFTYLFNIYYLYLNILFLQRFHNKLTLTPLQTPSGFHI